MNIKEIKALSGVRPSQPVRGEESRPSDSSRSGRGDAAGGADQLTLTPAARYLAGFTDGGEAAPVDRQRVEAIRNALANGTYDVDVERVAAKLLRIDSELL